MNATHTLSTGRVCALVQDDVPLARGCHVLACSDALSDDEIEEVLALAYLDGRAVARALHGDPECFTLLYNGARTRVRPWTHVHILPARSVAGKHWMLLCLSVKRMLRRVRRRLASL